MTNIKRIILIAVTVLFLVLPSLNAEYVQGQKESLRGIEGVNVAVENLKPNLKKVGLTEDLLRTDVELKLRLAGVKVLSEEERLKTVGMPFLYLNINTVTNPSDTIFAINISLQLVQLVNLLTQKDISTFARTWDTFRTGYVEDYNLKDEIRSTTKDLADVFLNDYLAVNPKQEEKPISKKETKDMNRLERIKNAKLKKERGEKLSVYEEWIIAVEEQKDKDVDISE